MRTRPDVVGQARSILRGARPGNLAGGTAIAGLSRSKKDEAGDRGRRWNRSSLKRRRRLVLFLFGELRAIGSARGGFDSQRGHRGARFCFPSFWSAGKASGKGGRPRPEGLGPIVAFRAFRPATPRAIFFFVANNAGESPKPIRPNDE